MLTAAQSAQIDAAYDSQSRLHDTLMTRYRSDELPWLGVDEHVFQSQLGHLVDYDHAITNAAPPASSRSLEAHAPAVSALLSYRQWLLTTVHRDVIRTAPNLGRIEAEQGELERGLDAVRNIPGMMAAVERHRGDVRRARQARAATPISEYPEDRPRVRVGDVSGPLQVVEIQPFGRVQTVNVETGAEVEFHFRDWLRRLDEVRHYERLHGRLAANPILQFGYGVAEGVSDGARGTIETLANLRRVLGQLYDMVRDLAATVRQLAHDLIRSVMDWGREFAGAELPQRARMLGRVLGAAVFEILTDVLSAGAGAAASVVRRAATRLRSSLAIVRRSRGLGGLARLAGVADDGLRVAGRAASRVITPAKRRILRARRMLATNVARTLAFAYHIADGFLAIGDELLVGSFQRVVRAGEEAFLFVIEGTDELVVTFGRDLELPDDMEVFPLGVERYVDQAACWR